MARLNAEDLESFDMLRQTFSSSGKVQSAPLRAMHKERLA